MALTQEEIISDFVDDFSSKITWLFERRDINGVFPVFLVLYSHKKKLPLPFVEYDGKNYERGENDLQDNLYDAADAFLCGSDEAYGKLTELDDFLDTISHKLFIEGYPRLVKETLLQTELARGTALMPNYRIAKTIANIIREHECESVYTMMSGVGTFSVACKGLDFTGAEPTAPAILISKFIDDAFGVRKSKYKNINPLKRWPRKITDAVIGNLPVDVDFFNEYRFNFQKKIDDDLIFFFSKSLKDRRANKVIISLANFNFANYTEYDGIRKRLCDEGILESVIALPEKIFRDAEVPTYIVVLDMNGGHKDATFIKATESLKRQSLFPNDNYDVRDCVDEKERITVPYSEMEKVNWVFNPSVYLQDAECRDGMQLVRLGDLVSIPKLGSFKGERNISKSFFSERFEKVALGVTPAASVNDRGNLGIEGPSFMMSLTAGRRNNDQKLQCAICKERGRYNVDCFTVILQPDTEKISLEYLALALMQDPSFVRYYKDIQAYYVDDIRHNSILARKIPILTDLAEQKKAVAEALGRADMADKIYNVILAGAGERAGWMKNSLAANGFNIQAVTDWVEGKDGLEGLVKNGTQNGVPVSKRIDAVIYNAGIALSQDCNKNYDGLDAAIDLQLLYDREGVSFFSFSDCDIDEIYSEGKISSRRMRHLNSGHFFRTTDKGDISTSLFLALKYELDTRNSIEPKIRTKYKEAFEAAEWLDSTYKKQDIHSVDIISDFLIASETESGDTSRKISDLRNVAHNIIEILKEYRAVPAELDNGAIPHLLYEREYKNNRTGKTFFQKEPIMPKSLASSLISLIDIGNEGTHTYKSSPGLSKIMMAILLELMDWFYTNKARFSKTLYGYWSENNKFEKIIMETVGFAECHSLKGNKKYWICSGTDIRLDDRGVNLKEGMKVYIKTVISYSGEKIEGIKWFAQPKSNMNEDGYTIEGDTNLTIQENGK